MREILFRGKRIDKGEWVEGSLWMHIGKPHIISNANCVGCRVDPSTVGQYTGLTDTNGKKIFERDIVQFRTRGGSLFKPLYVRWYEETASFIVTESNCVRSYPMDKTWEYEVLGNFYDNIDLLKGEQNEYTD